MLLIMSDCDKKESQLIITVKINVWPKSVLNYYFFN